jgi:hypothetical protein
MNCVKLNREKQKREKGNRLKFPILGIIDCFFFLYMFKNLFIVNNYNKESDFNEFILGRYYKKREEIR